MLQDYVAQQLESPFRKCWPRFRLLVCVWPKRLSGLLIRQRHSVSDLDGIGPLQNLMLLTAELR